MNRFQKRNRRKLGMDNIRKNKTNKSALFTF